MSTALRLATCLLVAAVLPACNKSEPASAPEAAANAAATPASQPAPAAEAAATTPAADDSAIVLTMDNVKAYTQVVKAVAQAEKSDPSIDIAQNVSEENNAQYLARLEATPKIRAAVAASGLSMRDFVRINETLIAAMMAEAALEAGQLKTLPDGMDQASVDFVKQHKAEIQALMGETG
jgi:hypothetical protein